MSGKFALIIGNTEYSDPGLAQLTAPGKDAEDFARVLQEKELCAFDNVYVLLNQPSFVINEAVEDFFDQKKPDDLLVLYFSGHGVRDELGMLYLAVKNTNRFRLRSTAVKSDFIREAMDQSRSKRQVLILDCCNSGAFSQGTKAATGVSIGTASAFEGGYGRVILTASDSTQFAWEGDQVIGETDNSLFTHFLVEGLQGEADIDGDGRITVDELYDYAYEKVKRATPKQTPSKFSSKQQGEIILRYNIRIEDIHPMPLPDDLISAIKSSLPFVREGAVRQLEDLLKSRHLGLARSARQTLEKIGEEDDSRTVSRAATQALESIRQAEELARKKEEDVQKGREAEDVKYIAMKKAETPRLVNERAAETEHLEKEKVEKYVAEKVKEEDKQKTVENAKQEFFQATNHREQKGKANLNISSTFFVSLQEFFSRILRNNGRLTVSIGLFSLLGFCYLTFAATKTIQQAGEKYTTSVSGSETALHIAQGALTKIKDETATAKAQTTQNAVINTDNTASIQDTQTSSANLTNSVMVQQTASAEVNAKTTAEVRATLTSQAKATNTAVARVTTNAQSTYSASSFYEDFSDNSKKWTLGVIDTERVTGSRNIMNNVYVWKITKVNSSFIYRNGYPDSDFVKDFDVSVDAIRILGTPGNFCYGIYFRYTEGAFYDFNVCDNQRFKIRYYDGNSWEDVKDWTSNKTIRENAWNKIGVIANGSNFYFYINDVMVSQIKDARLTEGYVGFSIYGYQDQQGQIQFDNFQINIE